MSLGTAGNTDPIPQSLSQQSSHYIDGHCTTIAVVRDINCQQNVVLFYNDMAGISLQEDKTFISENYTEVSGNVSS